jgi:hypothetical protein
MRITRSLLGAAALLTSFTNGAAEPISLAARAVPTVDLGYSVYQGVYDGNYSLNIFKRYDFVFSKALSWLDVN